MYFDLCIECRGDVANEIAFKCTSDLDQITMVHGENTTTMGHICSAMADQASSGVMDVSLQFHAQSPMRVQCPEDCHTE